MVFNKTDIELLIAILKEKGEQRQTGKQLVTQFILLQRKGFTTRDIRKMTEYVRNNIEDTEGTICSNESGYCWSKNPILIKETIEWLLAPFKAKIKTAESLERQSQIFKGFASHQSAMTLN